MKNKLFISIYCGLMILLASCNNYLDVKPKGKIIPKTAEDFSTIIHYWLDQIEKGRDDVIIPNPEVMTTLEMFADDLNATLASNFGYTSIYVGSAINKIRPLTKHSTLLSKTVIWLSATWMIRNPI